ncbi:acyl-CoA dehydrogenase family protein [Thalassomonas actiniarum]|uniref:3-sulfinopropanoyl-CoA desulfinase n=1 Tax=Thalassomonas actiniarum TaxID=485447 RepID=A0AAE9YXS8_9GAMM|nr:acyl-CoA dehydrogenase family protein [Thalassomonas actiniarum]WDE02527.1 acyl-CoA dehydrogenase family protein [Thalassomonas actiniarum]
MDIELTAEQEAARGQFRDFVERRLMPYADEYDRQEEMPARLIGEVAELGYLGGLVPEQYGGAGMDSITWGLLCEEIGRGSASLLSLFTVQGMVIQSILKWGNEDQRQDWLPRLATGEIIGGFALTEPNVGSNASSVETSATLIDGHWRLHGQKRWISFGQVSNLFVVFAQSEGKSVALLVERDCPGFSTKPITGMLGFRSAMLADIFLDGCKVPQAHLLGRAGFGFSHVGGAALDQGRYSIAWGCLGLAQGALDASLAYSGQRRQFGKPLKEHQLIQELLADMITQIQAARMLCYRAASLKQRGEPSLIMETSIAKYFASRMAAKVSADAVQIHGANGCSDQYPVQRYLRDAKIMEIIEGSNQMQQIIIAKHGYQEHAVKQQRLAQPKDDGGEA